jgi:hypothetical protein
VLLNFFIGWWGLPWGPIYTIGAIFNQIQGGKDVTTEVMSELIQNDPDQDTTSYGMNNQNRQNNNPQNNSTTYGINNQNNQNSRSEYNIPN